MHESRQLFCEKLHDGVLLDSESVLEIKAG